MANNPDLYLGEFGKQIFVNCQYDLSSATVVLLVMSASAGTFSVQTSVLGANYTTSAGEIFSVSRAVEYTFASGDFSGQADLNYRAWIEATFGTTAKLISSNFKFSVANPGD